MSSLNILFGLSLLTFLPSSSFGGAFDFYLLAQQWPGSYCKGSNLKQPCNMPYPKSDFKLHGLWPSNVSDPQPENCLTGSTLNIPMLSPLTAQLNNEWPNLNGNNDDFWKHQWTKHVSAVPAVTATTLIRPCRNPSLSSLSSVAAVTHPSVTLIRRCQNSRTPQLHHPSLPEPFIRNSSLTPTLSLRHSHRSRTLTKAIDALVIGRVVTSGNAKFEKDDLVMGVFTWAEYSLVKEQSIIKKLESFEFPLTYHLGILGFSGLSAYGGFFEICKPKKGEKVFVSAASGSVGNIVGQYAKLLGCYVVGCAGSQKKVALLKEELGFDDAFNYKEETDLNSALKRYFPDGIDIYFDNVGGVMLEAAVSNMKAFGRVSVCGVISEYTDVGKRASPNMLDVVYKRITIRGFLAADFMNVFGDFSAKTLDYLRNGQLQVIEDRSLGVESIPSAFVGLFNGDNIGKKVVVLADE